MKDKVAVIGLGYVGLPLAVAFAEFFPVVGFDTNHKRVSDLLSGHDSTFEVEKQDLASATNLILSSNEEDLHDCNIYIITVPTPVNKYKQPDLHPIKLASEMIGKVISEGDIVIYDCLLYTSPSPRDRSLSRMPSSA